MIKKILFYILGVAYAVVLPFVVLGVLSEIYYYNSHINQTLAFIFILAHIDLAGYFMYVMFKNKNK